MGTFSNPPILTGTPNHGDVVAWDATLGEWVPIPQPVFALLSIAVSGPIDRPAVAYPVSYADWWPPGLGCTSIPRAIVAGGHVIEEAFFYNPSASAAVELMYGSINVTNMDGTEVLSRYYGGDGVILAPGQNQVFDAAFLDQDNLEVGSDLSLASDGAIVSTAGGVFVAYATAQARLAA